MKKLIPILLILLFTSCVTGPSYMKDFGQDTSELPILVEGAITKSIDSESNDIIIQGNVTDYPATYWYRFFERYSAVERLWDGNISFNGEEQGLQVSALADHNQGDVDPNNFYNTHLNVSDIDMLQDVAIHKLSKDYSISNFNVFSSGGNFKLRLKDNEMPVVLTNFSIGNKEFSVLLTRMKFYGENERSSSTYLDLIDEELQLIQIVDTHALVYAEFTPSCYINKKSDLGIIEEHVYTEGFYRLFEVDPNFDETKIIPIIASFDVIKYMIQYSNLNIHWLEN